MVRNIVKHRNIYIFIIVLSLIGFISGIFYYKVQSNDTKEYIKNTINIENDLDSRFNNVFKSAKKSFLILGSGVFFLFIFMNVAKVFFEPFVIGFIFSFLMSYSLKMALIYSLFYQFIPFLFMIILIRVSFTISGLVVRIVFRRERRSILKFKRILLKYFIIMAFLLFYEFIIFIFSANINAYLMTFLSS